MISRNYEANGYRLGSIVNMIIGGDLYDGLVSMRIFTFDDEQDII